MDKILIEDLSVFFHVGVPDEERSRPQRLLLCLELERDFAQAVASDDLAHTLDYHALIQRIDSLGKSRAWNLIETLAWEIAGVAVNEFGASNAVVTVKKFILPETRYVGVQARRQSGTSS